MAGVCYYADEEYSEGSVIVVEGQEQFCADLGGYGDPQWVDDIDGTDEDTERELSDTPEGQPERGTDDDAGVVARKAVCYYGGKRYSLGARLKMPNGKVYRCGRGGTWVPPRPQ